MDVAASLDRIVSDRDLLQHPFYRAWSAGTLPADALAAYAREYGAFVRLLPEVWAATGDGETAEEEREHAEAWDAFAGALGTQVGAPAVPQVRELLAAARGLATDRATALGALYAFEVQQPATATSKLEGLRRFYRTTPEAERYFELHARNHHEAEKLRGRIADLDPAGRARAEEGCRVLASALWDGLTGLTPEGAC